MVVFLIADGLEPLHRDEDSFVSQAKRVLGYDPSKFEDLLKTGSSTDHRTIADLYSDNPDSLE